MLTAARIACVGSSVSEMLAGFRALAAIVRPAPLEAIARDLDDDHVLACALAAKAVLIVTRDRDLLDLGTSVTSASSPRTTRSSSSTAPRAEHLFH